MKKLRGTAAACSGSWGPGACATSALQVLSDFNDDPIFRLRVEQLTLLTDVWESLPPGIPAGARRAWSRYAEVLDQKPAAKRWRLVKGPIAAVCATVLDPGWIPRAIDIWEVPGSSDIRLGWGVEHGVDFTAFRKFHRALVHEGDYQRAAMLVTIAVGACWPEERLFLSGYMTSGQCPRCP
eukprot:4107480-Pyramimonas_sp.AAC.1